MSVNRLDGKQLEVLACPICKGPLVYLRQNGEVGSGSELICKGDRLAYPVKDGIAQLMESLARELEPTEEY
jgi:uncharacterized protein